MSRNKLFVVITAFICGVSMFFLAIGFMIGLFSQKSTFDTKGLPELPRSLGIKVPNVDLSYYIDPRPIFPEQVNLLIEKGVLPTEAEQMTYGEFKLACREFKMDELRLYYAQTIAPEIAQEAKNWTWGQYDDYLEMKTYERLKPADDLEKQLNELGLTTADAVLIGREYYGYDYEKMIGELKTTEGRERIKSYVEDEYYMKLSYIQYDAKDEEAGR